MVDQDAARVRPPPIVIEAFGAKGEPVALPGGRGLAWRVDDLVFKPADLAPDEVAWEADVLPTVQASDIRVSIPQRASTGGLVVEGWTAWSYLPGEHRAGRWLEVIAVGDRFHKAVAGLDRPSFIAARIDPWAIADRVAWGEAPIDPYLDVPHVARLAALRGPVDAPSQLIHGDLTGNVLFADDRPPAVIDLSPYWRPTGFATAIVVADALVWEGADESLLDSVAAVDDIAQMLIRALLYRLVAAAEGGFEAEGEIRERYLRAVAAAVQRTRG
jgi:uncharacterized protein (TIGR02569 family)